MTGDRLANVEGRTDFDVHWPWSVGPLRPGMTAVIRARDEARNLPWVLPALLDCVDEVVLVDNQSTDTTGAVAREIAERHDAGDRLRVCAYPFDVSPCGADHLRTPERSVHSLAFYYNWAFSHVRTTYSIKWDGDMVLTPEGRGLLTDLAWQLGGREVVMMIPHFPLYVESERVGYFDVGGRNMEPWIYPMGPEYTYVKGFDWEVREFPERVERVNLPAGLCFEVKWLDVDEFANWGSTRTFDQERLPRKAREHRVFHALRQGEVAALDGVHMVEAPPGVHVIDHVASSWLPARPRPIV